MLYLPHAYHISLNPSNICCPVGSFNYCTPRLFQRQRLKTALQRHDGINIYPTCVVMVTIRVTPREYRYRPEMIKPLLLNATLDWGKLPVVHLGECKKLIVGSLLLWNGFLQLTLNLLKTTYVVLY